MSEKSIKLNKTDSRFFGRNIVAWEPEEIIGKEEIIATEKEIIGRYNPAMITAFLTVGKIETAGHFEDCGYQFAECRLLAEKEMNESAKTYNLFPYKFDEITGRSQLNQLKKATDNMLIDDRFFSDPQVDNQLAMRRNHYFLEQSFKRKNEFIFLLQNNNTNELLGFRSFKIKSKNEASMLITGVIKEKQKENIQELINLFELEVLAEMGIRFIKTVISVQNYDEINRYIAKYDYEIQDSKILLRKLFRSLD